jgi:hypothetical protein
MDRVHDNLNFSEKNFFFSLLPSACSVPPLVFRPIEFFDCCFGFGIVSYFYFLFFPKYLIPLLSAQNALRLILQTMVKSLLVAPVFFGAVQSICSYHLQFTSL